MSGAIEAFQRRRAFLVENEYLLADEVAEALDQAGVSVVGPASKP